MTGTHDQDPYRAELRARVRAFVDQWRTDRHVEPTCDSWMRGFDPEFSRALAARGWIGITWPTEFGGAGSSNRDRLAVTEELLRAGAPIAAHWIGDRQIGPAILRHGTEELRKELLPAITAGEAVYCLGMSEPGAGSDLASVTTRADRVEGGWRVSGRKVWTSHAHHATHMYLLARTEKAERKHQGLSEFVLDLPSEGIEISPIRDLSGEHHFNEVVLDGVFVPEHRLLGTAGDGWRQVVEQLSFERGGPERVLSTYPLLAELIGHPTARQPHIATRLGGLAARLATLRRLAWELAGALDDGRAPVQEAVTLKYLGNAFECSVVELAREVFGAGGGAGARLFRGALAAQPGFTIRGGAADVLLGLLAREEAR
ncbi:acyl-CoA dehydrogenase family protein [Pseudonocardia xishanensis]|uniref:Acyl-CoA dehydrogenase family protein n=1 Tax=Pseudonocardia xishanensis TaxID=630995 RepID=A0ABP8RTF3_9PSEU